MGLVDDLAIILGSYSEGYRFMRARMHGYPHRNQTARDALDRLRRTSEAAIRVTLSRLKKKGFVQNARGTWKLTSRGRQRWLRNVIVLPAHSPLVIKKKSKNLIIAFDIPEKEKRKRNWLRLELLCLGFEKLQKSVWFGPAPLPQTFINNLEDLNLLPHLKFFEAKEADLI